ncbi:MAG: hypothetical protein ACM33B_04130 [Pseudomonadota bacterium]
MDGGDRERKRDRMRSFVLGGIVGAGAAVAAGRRLRPRPKARQTPAGLAAFEGAPCYRELVDRERADGS